MTNDELLLQTLAQADPQFASFEADLPPAVAQADLPADLLTDLIAALPTERPDLTEPLATWTGTPPQSYSVIALTGTLAAALFLLRSRIEFKRDTDGNWSFSFKHLPANNSLLEKLLDVVKGILTPAVDRWTP
jgi:hypothetical protein